MPATHRPQAYACNHLKIRQIDASWWYPEIRHANVNHRSEFGHQKKKNIFFDVQNTAKKGSIQPADNQHINGKCLPHKSSRHLPLKRYESEN